MHVSTFYQSENFFNQTGETESDSFSQQSAELEAGHVALLLGDGGFGGRLEDLKQHLVNLRCLERQKYGAKA